MEGERLYNYYPVVRRTKGFENKDEPLSSVKCLRKHCLFTSFFDMHIKPMPMSLLKMVGQAHYQWDSALCSRWFTVHFLLFFDDNHTVEFWDKYCFFVHVWILDFCQCPSYCHRNYPQHMFLLPQSNWCFPFLSWFIELLL